MSRKMPNLGIDAESISAVELVFSRLGGLRESGDMRDG